MVKSLYPPNQFAVNVDLRDVKSIQNFVIILEKLDDILVCISVSFYLNSIIQIILILANQIDGHYRSEPNVYLHD